MALDSSIALQVKQPQFENPLAQMAQLSQVQGLQNQNQLAQYTLAKARRDDEDTTAVRNLLTSTPGDLNAKYNALMNGGFHQQAMALKKSQLEQDEKQSMIGKNNAEAGKKVQETAEAKRQQAVQDMASFETPADALASLRHHAAKGDIDPQQAELMARNIPTDPTQFAQWQVGMLRKLMAPKDQVALTTPDANAQLSANTSLATTGMNNRTALAANGATVGATMRGQDMSQATAVRGQDLTNDRALEINDSKREEAKLKAAAEKAPNSEQGKAMSYAARMQQSHGIMEEMLAGGTKTPSKIKGALDSIPLVGEGLGSVANTFVANKDQQKLEQAQRDFINADLRHESGASISPAEFDNARRQYFPMPGDGPDVIAQKAQNRRIAIEGMKVQAGPGAAKIDGILDRSSIDLTKVKPGTPEYKAVMADAANIGALRNKAKPTAKPSLDDIFGK